MTGNAKARPRVLLVCTTETASIAENLRRPLAATAEVKLWVDDADGYPQAPGATLSSLLAEARRHDFLILVLGAGDLLARRGARRRSLPFEAGLLIGAVGGERSLLALAPGARTPRIPADLFDGVFAPPRFRLREGETDLAAAAMGAVIAQRWATAPPALLPSTGIAIGYFRNFVKPVCDYLAGGDVTIGADRFTGPGFDFIFDIIIPASLDDATPAGERRFWALNASRLTDRSLDIGRRYPFFIRTGFETNPLRIVDYPAPLSASVDAVTLVLRGEQGDREQARVLLGAREIDNFETTLAALIAGDPPIARHVRTRRLPGDGVLPED
jgi:hypothetical protein